jgi:hypothetical protein
MLTALLSLLAEAARFVIGHFMILQGVLRLAQSRLVMGGDLRSFTVEMYTPGEIVDGRRSYDAETATHALHAATAWINEADHNATHLRVVGDDGTIMFDKLVAEAA